MQYSRTNDLLNQAKTLLDQARDAAERDDKLPQAMQKAIGTLVGRTEHIQWQISRRISRK